MIVAYKLNAADDAVNGGDKAQKAFKPGYDVTADPFYQDGVEVPPLRDDYEICKRFEGTDPSLEVGACVRALPALVLFCVSPCCQPKNRSTF